MNCPRNIIRNGWKWKGSSTLPTSATSCRNGDLGTPPELPLLLWFVLPAGLSWLVRGGGTGEEGGGTISGAKQPGRAPSAIKPSGIQIRFSSKLIPTTVGSGHDAGWPPAVGTRVGQA